MVSFLTQNNASIIEQAINVSTEGIVITDALDSQNPIVYVNKGFEKITGYTRDEIIGKNCRMLQGAGTNISAVAAISNAVSEKSACTVELINYRKDGSPFWNRLSITPLRNIDGITTHFVGVQSDITELRNTKEELEKANAQLETFFTEMIREMEQARIAQEHLMPRELPESSFVKFAVKYDPLEQIGGDFYDIFELGGHNYGVLLADTTGHGIPAALLTFMTSNTFKGAYPGELSTRKVIEKTNNTLFKQMPDGTFVTMSYMVYNSKSRELYFTQAGSPAALLIRTRKNTVDILRTRGTLVGIIPPEIARYDQIKLELQAGDKVLLFTDAVLEANNLTGDILDIETLQQFVLQNINLPIEKLIDSVYQFGLTAANRAKYLDDATLVGFQVLS